MLAARRTDRVSGRMTLLTSSIITMKGIKAGGVPSGTRWAIIAFGVFAHPMIIWPSHKGRARATVKERCLEAVKIKGNKPKALFSKMNTIRATGIRDSPGAEVLPRIA